MKYHNCKPSISVMLNCLVSINSMSNGNTFPKRKQHKTQSKTAYLWQFFDWVFPSLLGLFKLTIV